MRALSTRQPWAHRILHEGKDIENRDWPTKFRGWVLIHAGKGVDPEDRDEVRGRGMPLGGIVGMMEIFGCVDRSDSPWFFGRYGFVIRDRRPLPFIPCKGALGFFRPDIRDQVIAMWHRAELSEGQGSRILGVDRLEFRRLCDESRVDA
jgi:hypothetical protein